MSDFYYYYSAFPGDPVRADRQVLGVPAVLRARGPLRRVVHAARARRVDAARHQGPRRGARHRLQEAVRRHVMREDK